jgi:threonine aldolase
MVNLCSDNATGVAPEIIRAIEAANAGTAMPYGNDDLTGQVEAKLSEVFETEVTAFPVGTGTAANVLCLSVMTPPFGVIYCHEGAHIHVDECGGAEFYTGGAKLCPLPGSRGKIAPDTLRAAITGVGEPHHAQPASVSLTQATEAGTLYTPDEVAAIAEVARANRLNLHMDGARFANAVAALGCSPADVTWRAGVDALSFGATKNGGMSAEAVVFFKRELAETFAYRRMKGGHLFSKMRFLSAQLQAYLHDDLWLRHARHANAMAARLVEGLRALPGADLVNPVEANELFVRLPEAVIAGLLDRGFRFYRWGGPTSTEVRLVTAFNTDPADVDRFLQAAHALAASHGKSGAALAR